MEIGTVAHQLHVEAPLHGMGHHRLGGASRHVEGQKVMGQQLPFRHGSRGVQGGHDVSALVGETAHLASAARGESLGGHDAREEAGHIGICGIPRSGRHAHTCDGVATRLQNTPQLPCNGGEILHVGKNRITLS